VPIRIKLSGKVPSPLHQIPSLFLLPSVKSLPYFSSPCGRRCHEVAEEGEERVRVRGMLSVVWHFPLTPVGNDGTEFLVGTQ